MALVGESPVAEPALLCNTARSIMAVLHPKVRRAGVMFVIVAAGLPLKDWATYMNRVEYVGCFRLPNPLAMQETYAAEKSFA